MVRSPELVPSYHDLFFTRYMTVLELVTFLGQFPLILLHELAHALAGRRLGLRTRLSIDRRMYYVVFVTELDGLVTVPRRKRNLPDPAVSTPWPARGAGLREPGGHVTRRSGGRC